MPDNDSEYETSDLNLAAYLAMAGCTMVRKRMEGRRAFFLFQNPGGSMKGMRDAYFSGQGKVSAYQYAQHVKAYKEMAASS